MIAGSQAHFFKCIWNESCSWSALLKFWFQTDLGRDNSAGFYMQGRQSLLTFLTIVTRWSRSKPNFYALIGKIWQVSSCGKFMQHLDTCLLWQSFVSYCDVSDSLFLLDVQNEIQLLSRFFYNSWLLCLLRFWLRNALLVKVVRNPISGGTIFKYELTHLPLLEA